VLVKDLKELLDNISEFNLAETWDNVGLSLGSDNAKIDNVLVCLDLTLDSIKAARKASCNLIITHHPLIFKEIKKIEYDDPTGKIIKEAITSNINHIACHTNLDKSKGGLNDIVASYLGLEDTAPILPDSDLYKIVVFVPHKDSQRVHKAMSVAGGGRLGNYDYTSFRTSGVGTFRPLLGANPALGQINTINEVEENRLEMIVSGQKIKAVGKAMLKAHPYEEVAYDVYKLAPGSTSSDVGLGRIGYLEKPLKMAGLIKKLSKDFTFIRTNTTKAKLVKKIAVCTGSGASLLTEVVKQKADVYLTGDISYHHVDLANKLGLSLIEVGHFDLESFAMKRFSTMLNKQLSPNIKVKFYNLKNPWQKNYATTR